MNGFFVGMFLWSWSWFFSRVIKIRKRKWLFDWNCDLGWLFLGFQGVSNWNFVTLVDWNFIWLDQCKESLLCICFWWILIDWFVQINHCFIRSWNVWTNWRSRVALIVLYRYLLWFVDYSWLLNLFCFCGLFLLRLGILLNILMNTRLFLLVFLFSWWFTRFRPRNLVVIVFLNIFSCNRLRLP